MSGDVKLATFCAFEPIVCSAGGVPYNKAHLDAKDAEIRYLRARLAARPSLPTPDAEPVARPDAYQHLIDGKWVECSEFVAKGWSNELSPGTRALYTHPAPTPSAVAKCDEGFRAGVEAAEGSAVQMLRRVRKWLLEVPPPGTYGCVTLLRAIDKALALSPPPAGDGWRGIDSAPKDGTVVIVFGGRYETPVAVPADGDWWRSKTGRETNAVPTHWRPLPAPPIPGGGHDKA